LIAGGLRPGNVREALVACRLRHPRVHLRVLVGLAGDGGAEVLVRAADRLVGRRIADALQVVQVTVGVARLGLGGIPEQAAHVRVALDVRLLGEVEVAAVGHGLAAEGLLQVVVRLAALELAHALLPSSPASWDRMLRPVRGRLWWRRSARRRRDGPRAAW